MRRTTEAGMTKLVEREGLRLTAYRDSANLLTIGVGHLLTRSELSSGKIRLGLNITRWNDGITHDEAMQLLRQDLHPAEAAVDRDATHVARSHAPLTDAQFDALVSFVFNVGVGAYDGSTLRRELLAGHLRAIPAQMMRWVHAGGMVVQGLKNRRESEAVAFNS